MNQEEKKLLADSYAHAWMAVKGGTTTVEVLDHGWFVIRHSYIPMYSQKVRAIKLLKGLATLTKRLANNDRE
jgi:hypothetical protein